jgi:hypothetical protein
MPYMPFQCAVECYVFLTEYSLNQAGNPVITTWMTWRTYRLAQKDNAGPHVCVQSKIVEF